MAVLERTVDKFPEILEGEWPPELIGQAVPMFSAWSDYTGRLLNREPGFLDAVRAEAKLMFRLGEPDGAFEALENACSMGDGKSCAMLRERTELISD